MINQNKFIKNADDAKKISMIQHQLFLIFLLILTFLVNEMNLELKQHSDASQTRSKSEGIEEGENNIPYFLSLGKKLQCDNVIHTCTSKVKTNDTVAKK